MACATANALSGVVFIGRPLAGRAAARSYVDRSTAQNRDDHRGPSELRMAISYEFWRAVSGPERETVIDPLQNFAPAGRCRPSGGRWGTGTKPASFETSWQ